MKKALITSFLLLAGFLVSAQTYTRLSYPISFAAGNTADRISMTSFIGFNIEIGHEIHNNSFFGIESGWVTLYDELNDHVSTLGTTTVRGTQYRYFNAIPILAKYSRRWNYTETTKPFAAIGAGLSYAESRTDVGILSAIEEAWPVTFSPEIGATFDVGSYSLLTLSAAYTYMFERSDLPSQQYFSLRIGIAWE